MAKPEGKQQVVVRAYYSDGHAEDVTRWAKFYSTQDLVATVDDTGQVAVHGYGEASINVIYSNDVAFARITSPMPTAIDSALFARSPRVNYVDDLNLKKLETLRLPPSPLAGDNEFIRRSFLDAAGILPTPEEVQRFVQDTSPDKRAKLIDSLLERSEFVDYCCWSLRASCRDPGCGRSTIGCASVWRRTSPGTDLPARSSPQPAARRKTVRETTSSCTRM
jgi:hypothetical protein